MLLFISLFFPAVISVCICDRICGGHIAKRSCVYLYAVSNVAVNVICAVFKKFVFETADSELALYSGDMSPSIMLNYMVIAIPSAVIVGCVAALIHKGVKVTKE